MIPSLRLLELLGLEKFIAFDFETTGLEPERDQIIEIGAVLWEGGEEREQFTPLVKPQEVVTPQIFKLTGIEPSKLKRAPGIAAVFPDFTAFMADIPVVAHNLDFDLNFYQKTAAALQQPAPVIPPSHRFDTLQLARFILPTLPNHRLGTVCSQLEIRLDSAHRAVHDARATGQLLLCLLQVASTFEDRLLEELRLITTGTQSYAERLVQGLLQFRAEEQTFGAEPCWQPLFRKNVIHHRADAAGEEIAPDSIEEYFSRDGKLSAQLGGFHERSEQIQLAEDVAATGVDDTFLVAQAGTGIGKSYAYLYPAVRQAIQRRQRIVVSTHTRNLQEQIFYRDLPDMLHGVEAACKAVLLKGRQNYICRNRWRNLLQNWREKLSQQDWEKLLPLSVWLQGTLTGDIEECTAFRHYLHPGVWSRLRSEAATCNGGLCRTHDGGCYLTRVRRQAQNCDLVVINHSLLLSDLAADRGVLGDYDRLIIDEGHNLVEAAERQLKTELNFRQLKQVLNSLYQENTGERGALVQVRAAVTFVGLPDARQAEFRDAVQESIESVIQCAVLTDQLRQASVEANQAHAENIKALKFTLKKRFKGETNPLAVHHAVTTQLTEAGGCLQNGLQQLTEQLEATAEQLFPDDAAPLQDLLSLRDQWRLVLERLELFCAAADPETVHWEEIHPRTLESTFYACPLAIAAKLRERLFACLKQLVVVSATLTVNRNFDYFLEQTGLDDSPRPLQTRLYGSPFDYERQVRFLIPQYFSDAVRDNSRFVSQLADLVEATSVRHGIGTMILFTSYRLLNNTYSELIERIDYHQTPILGQGLDGTRDAILEQFRATRGGILLGTESFWQGVDIPGSALEMLIITKLPFAVPTEPMVQARYEQIEAEGRSSFMSHAVPAAVLKFRQGFGRLIRSETDRGLVILLDRRVAVKQYGKAFTESVETPAAVVYQQEMLTRAVDDFLGER